MNKANEGQKKLIRLIQQGFVSVDVRTGDVTSCMDADWTGQEDYLGTLPRKLIPNRRNLERQLREARASELEQLSKRTEPRRFKNIQGEAGIYMLLAQKKANKGYEGW